MQQAYSYRQSQNLQLLINSSFLLERYNLRLAAIQLNCAMQANRVKRKEMIKKWVLFISFIGMLFRIRNSYIVLYCCFIYVWHYSCLLY